LLLTSASLDQAPPDEKKALYLQYAKLEEDYGLAKRAMNVYDEAVRAVPNSQKMSMYEIYIARAAELFGVPRTRQIYEVSSLSRLSYAFPFVLYSLLLDWH
jgi:pre-mRNA-splicing factor SYF1